MHRGGEKLLPQVQPPLSNREMVTLFIDTLGDPYYEMMIGSISSNFLDIVMTEERIKARIRSGKIASSVASNAKNPFNGSNKKRNDNAVMINTPEAGPFQPNHPIAYINYPSITPCSPIPNPITPYFMSPPSQPNTSATQSPHPNQAQHPNNTQPRQQNSLERKPVHFDPIPVSYTELLPHLIKNRLLVPIPMKPLSPPYPKGYNQNSKSQIPPWCRWSFHRELSIPEV
jgi:hypothetical protein